MRDSPSTSARHGLRLPGGRVLEWSPGRPLVMGVLNITPDSFSDGGRWLAPERAVERALEMLEQGADLLDLGAESTRPGGGVYGDGARDVPPGEEWSRLAPVLARLRAATDAPLSIDTRKGEVARNALDAGADLINDVGGGDDPRLLDAVARAGCPVVIMHSRGEIGSMQRQIHFDDVVREVRDELAARGEAALAAGAREEQLIYDPGLGFGKTGPQNLRLLAELDVLAELGRPLLVGASRKSFLGAAAARGGETPPPDRRLGASLAAVEIAARHDAAIVRVHDVAETVQFLTLRKAIPEARMR